MGNGMEKETERILLENYDKYYRHSEIARKSEHDALDVVQESAYKAIRDCGKVKERRYLALGFIGLW